MFYMKNYLYIINLTILSILGINQVKASFAAEPHGDEHLHKYAQNPAFEASILLKKNALCSASRIKIDKNDPVDFFITAAHCLKKLDRDILTSVLQTEGIEYVQQEDIGYIIHPKQDLLIFTVNKPSNQLKYELYTGSPNDLIEKTVTNVAFGESLLNNENIGKRQAFDVTIESVENNQLFSGYFLPSSNVTLEHNPIGITTQGDSGGSLLIKEKDQYRLAGVVKSFQPFDETEEALYIGSGFLYKAIPENLRTNSHNQHCLISSSLLSKRPCYGDIAIWEYIDLKFIKNAKKDLLAKTPVYAHPSQTNPDYPLITFSLKDGINEYHFEEENNIIGYACENAKLIVSVEKNEFFTIPLQLGNVNFTYQSAGKHYPMQVTVQQSTDGKSLIVKGIVHNNEQDERTPNNLADNWAKNTSKLAGVTPSFAKPVYLSYRNSGDLPLEITLDKCLSNRDFTDTDCSQNAKILGHVGNNYDVVFSLEGQELERFNNQQLSNENGKTTFKFSYFGTIYQAEIAKFEKENSGQIFLNVETVVSGPYSLGEMKAAFPYEHTPLSFTRSCGMAGDVPISIALSPMDNDLLLLFTANQFTQAFRISEGSHCFTYRNNDNGTVYAIEINIQISNTIKPHYSIDLNVKELHKDLSPASVNNPFTFDPSFKTDDSCKNEWAAIPVRCAITYFCRLNLDTLNPIVVLDKNSQEIYRDRNFQYVAEHSIAHVLIDDERVLTFKLEAGTRKTIKLEKDGRFYILEVSVQEDKEHASNFSNTVVPLKILLHTQFTPS